MVTRNKRINTFLNKKEVCMFFSKLTGGEASPLVAASELDVEVGNQSMNVVVSFNLQAEWWGEGQVLQLHCVDVHLLENKSLLDHRCSIQDLYYIIIWETLIAYLYETGTADQLFGVYYINQRFLNCHLLDARHIKTVHTLPPCHRIEGIQVTHQLHGIEKIDLNLNQDQLKSYLQWIL